MKKFNTTVEFIASHVKASGYTANEEIIKMLGYSTIGAVGGAKWKPTGNVIAVSQDPLALNDVKLSDASGNEFELVLEEAGIIDLNVLGGTSAAFVNIATAAGLIFSQGLSPVVAQNDVVNIDTVTTIKNRAGVSVGEAFMVEERSSGVFDSVVTGTTPNVDLPDERKIIQSTEDPLISFVLRDSDILLDVPTWGIKSDNSDEGLSIQAACDFSYDNIGELFFPFGQNSMGDSTLEFPPSTTTEFRGDAFKLIGQGAANAFVTAAHPLTSEITNTSTSKPVIHYVNRLGFVNTGGAFHMEGLRVEANNTVQAILFDQIGEYAKFTRMEINQAGIGDGLTIEYFLKGNIEASNILNVDAFSFNVPRTGAAIRIKAGDGGGIPTIKKITGRGFNTAFILGENATTTDNMSGLKLEQVESSVVKVGIDLRLNTLKPTLDTCYFEGIEETHIIDNGTASDIHGGNHFFNALAEHGVTYYKSTLGTKGNSLHHSYLECNRPNDTLADISFDEHKSFHHNTLLFSGIESTGLTAIKVRGIFPKVDISSTAFSPRGAWVGGAAGKHNGPVSTTVLTDPLANYVVNGLVGLRLLNFTKNIDSIILSNTATTITTSLLGAGLSHDVGDVYTLSVSSLNGIHSGVPSANVLTASTASFVVNGLVGMTLTNGENNETTIVTSNTATTITGLLSNGGVWAAGNIYILGFANSRGAHDGAGSAAFLTDLLATFGPDSLEGLVITNETDSSSGTITTNTQTTVIATLSGGTNNNWQVGDIYTINDPTVKIRDMSTGGVITGTTEAQNGPDFSCPMTHGAYTLISGQIALTEAHVAGNTLTIPDDVNFFLFTPTIAVSINVIRAKNPNNQPVYFDCTNTLVTFTNSSFVKLDGGTTYTGLGMISHMLTKIGVNHFSKENHRMAVV